MNLCQWIEIRWLHYYCLYHLHLCLKYRPKSKMCRPWYLYWCTQVYRSMCFDKGLWCWWSQIIYNIYVYKSDVHSLVTSITLSLSETSIRFYIYLNLTPKLNKNAFILYLILTPKLNKNFITVKMWKSMSNRSMIIIYIKYHLQLRK